MGNSIHDKGSQKEYLKNRLDMFMNVLDSMDPEDAGVEEIDRLLEMIDDIEGKIKQFRRDWE
jgi:hypothetical protein